VAAVAEVPELAEMEVRHHQEQPSLVAQDYLQTYLELR
jgi:hypothetical protein